MGLLDSLLKTASDAMQPGSPSPGGNPLDALTALLQGHGGLGGLLGKLRESGLGAQVDSWVSTGKNLPVSADGITAALGDGQLAQIAQRLGIDPQQLAGQLANVLPNAVDRLTPDGQLPADGAISSALEMLKGRLGA